MVCDLKCPYCGDDDVLLNGRLDSDFDGDAVYVVWEAKCHHCGRVFTRYDTYSLTNSRAEKSENK